MSNYTKSTNFATKDNLTPGDPLKIVRGTEIDTEFNNIATAIATKTDNASAAITGGTINDTTIGATTASTGAFTTLAASGNVTLSGGTANGVPYLNGSKVVTSGSALVFDATNTALSVGGAATNTAANRGNISINGTSTAILSLSTGASAKGYVYHSGSDMIVNATTGTLALQANGNGALIDSSGNLGLGVTPTNNTLGKTLQNGQAGAWTAETGTNRWWLGSNWYYNSGDKYINNGYATLYSQQNGTHQWSTSASGTAGNAITFTQAMTLDASGNLGIGTTSPEANGRLTLDRASSNYLMLRSGGTNRMSLYVDSGVSVVDAQANPLVFNAGSAERARIDSSGNLLVGTTSAGGNGFTLYPTGSGGGVYTIYNRPATSNTTTALDFKDGGTTVGSISYTNTVTSFNTTSDQRLKENITDADSASTLIDALQVRKFDWKADGSHQRYGFVAQELVTVAPEAVHQPEDTEQMMAVDYSKLVPMLVKEIQSLRQRVAQLESN